MSSVREDAWKVSITRSNAFVFSAWRGREGEAEMGGEVGREKGPEGRAVSYVHSALELTFLKAHRFTIPLQTHKMKLHTNHNTSVPFLPLSSMPTPRPPFFSS